MNKQQPDAAPRPRRNGWGFFDRLDASKADGTARFCRCGQENPASDDQCINCLAPLDQ